MRKIEGHCQFPGCEFPLVGRGLCGTHYAQRRRGKELTPITVRPRRPMPIPVIDGDTIKIPLTKGLFAIVDIIDAELGEKRWYARNVNKISYAARGTASNETIHLHREVLRRAGVILAEGEMPDHIDGDGLNNRRSNLRKATTFENRWNMKDPIINTSGRRGVTWTPRLGKWRARIGKMHRRRHLGYFDSFEAAAQAHRDAVKELHGEFGHD